MDIAKDKPLFPLSVASKITNIPAKMLNYFERQGLISPAKTPGNRRLYSKENLIRVFTIKYLKEKMGLNSAGIKLMLEVMDYAKQKGIDLKARFFKDLNEEEQLKKQLER